MVTGFDTLRAARQLKEAGLAEPAAEAIAEVLRESRELDLSQLATKADLAQLATKMDLGTLGTEIERGKTDIAALRAEIERGKNGVLKWATGLLIAQGAAIVTLLHFLGHG